jgi:predicted membrane protein
MSDTHLFLLLFAVFVGTVTIVMAIQNIYYKSQMKKYNEQVEAQKVKIENYRKMMKEQQRIVYRPKN